MLTFILAKNPALRHAHQAVNRNHKISHAGITISKIRVEENASGIEQDGGGAAISSPSTHSPKEKPRLA